MTEAERPEKRTPAQWGALVKEREASGQSQHRICVLCRAWNRAEQLALPASASAGKDKPVRKPLPSHLSRAGRIVYLPDADKQAMGSDWIFIGYDESEHLAMIPRQPCVIVFIRARIDDEVSGAERGVVIASREPQINSRLSPTARCSPKWWRASSSMPCRCIARRKSSTGTGSRSAARA